MIFLGYPSGVKGYLFMRLPNNVLFKGTTAIFDKEMMPKCTKVVRQHFTPIGNKTHKSKEDPPIPLKADDDDDDFVKLLRHGRVFLLSFILYLIIYVTL